MKLENVQSRKQEAVKPSPRTKKLHLFHYFENFNSTQGKAPLQKSLETPLSTTCVEQWDKFPETTCVRNLECPITHFATHLILQPNKSGHITLFPRVPGPVGARRRHRHRRRILVLLHNVTLATHPGGGVGQLIGEMTCSKLK